MQADLVCAASQVHAALPVLTAVPSQPVQVVLG
jgi:hypothetical protein